MAPTRTLATRPDLDDDPKPKAAHRTANVLTARHMTQREVRQPVKPANAAAASAGPDPVNRPKPSPVRRPKPASARGPDPASSSKPTPAKASVVRSTVSRRSAPKVSPKAAYVIADLAADLSSIPPVFWGDGIPAGKRADDSGAKSATVAELRALHKLVAGANPPTLKKDALVAFVRAVIDAVAKTGTAPTTNPKRVTKFSEVEYIPYDGATLTGSALRETLDRDGMAVVPLPTFKTSWLEDYQLWLEDFANKQTLEREEYGEAERVANGRGSEQSELRERSDRRKATVATPVYDRNDPTTWLNKNIPTSTRGIFKQWLAHTPFQWEIREACASIFADIYDCTPTELITSYDGGSVTFPSRRPSDKTKFVAWFHNDQPRTMPDFDCWQGVVYLSPSGERDPGTVTYARSKDVWPQYNELRPSEGHKWGMMDTELLEQLLTTEHGEARIVRYEVPQFHMFIFNSRVAHCSYPGMPGCDPRFAVYVSMVPRLYLSEAELAKKVKYYEENRMTSHWSFGPYFSANGGVRIYNERKPVIPESPHLLELTPLMRRLAGYSG